MKRLACTGPTENCYSISIYWRFLLWDLGPQSSFLQNVLTIVISFSTSLFFLSETSSNILPQEGDVSDRVAGYLSPFYHYQPPLPQFGNMAAGGWPPNYPHRPMMPFGVGYPSGKFFTLETLSNNTLVKICIKLIEFLVLNVSVD